MDNSVIVGKMLGNINIVPLMNVKGTYTSEGLWYSEVEHRESGTKWTSIHIYILPISDLVL